MGSLDIEEIDIDSGQRNVELARNTPYTMPRRIYSFISSSSLRLVHKPTRLFHPEYTISRGILRHSTNGHG